MKTTNVILILIVIVAIVGLVKFNNLFSILPVSNPQFVHFSGVPKSGGGSYGAITPSWWAGNIYSDSAILDNWKVEFSQSNGNNGEVIKYECATSSTQYCQSLPSDATNVQTTYIDSENCQHWSYVVPSVCHREYTQCGGTGCAGWLCTPFTSSITNCYRDVCTEEQIVSDYGGMSVTIINKPDIYGCILASKGTATLEGINYRGMCSGSFKVYKNNNLIFTSLEKMNRENFPNAMIYTFSDDGTIRYGEFRDKGGIIVYFMQNRYGYGNYEDLFTCYAYSNSIEYVIPSASAFDVDLKTEGCQSCSSQFCIQVCSPKTTYYRDEDINFKVTIVNNWKEVYSDITLDFTIPTILQTPSTQTVVLNNKFLKVGNNEFNYTIKAKQTGDILVTPKITVNIPSNKFSGINYGSPSKDVSSYSSIPLGSVTLETKNVTITTREAELIQQILSKEQELAILKGNLAEREAKIKEITTLLSEQAEILKILNLTAQENGQLIIRLQNENSKQAELLDNLNKTIKENILIMQNMSKNIAEQLEMIKILSDNKKELDLYVNELLVQVAFQKDKIIELDNLIKIDAQRIAQLDATVAEKLAIITSLESNIAKQLEYINQLSKTKAEKDLYINELLREIAFQKDKIIELDNLIEINAQRIAQLDATVAEKLAIIDALSKNIEEKDRMIVEMTKNLESQKEKLAMMQQVVDDLDRDYAEAKNLIIQLREILGTAEGRVAFLLTTVDKLQIDNTQLKDLINSYESTIQEDALLIGKLRLREAELIGLVEGYKNDLMKEIALVNELKLSNEVMKKIITDYENKLREEQEISSKLKESNRELGELIELYKSQLKTSEEIVEDMKADNLRMGEIIGELNISNKELGRILENYKNKLISSEEVINRLNISNQELGELIKEYKGRLITAEEVIAKLGISNEEFKKLIAEYEERIDKMAKYLSELKLNNEELIRLVNSITDNDYERNLLLERTEKPKLNIFAWVIGGIIAIFIIRELIKK